MNLEYIYCGDCGYEASHVYRNDVPAILTWIGATHEI